MLQRECSVAEGGFEQDPDRNQEQDDEDHQERQDADPSPGNAEGPALRTQSHPDAHALIAHDQLTKSCRGKFVRRSQPVSVMEIVSDMPKPLART